MESQSRSNEQLGVKWRGKPLMALNMAIGISMLLGLCGIGCHSDVKIERVGIPEGATGVLTAYVLREKMARHGSIRQVHFEPYALYDCCAAATQYALGSGHLDMAVMCPDAAAALIAKDERYLVVGPLMYNSDVLVLREKPRANPPNIAVSQNRDRQRRLISARFGDSARVVPMLHSAVPFAFARDQVDGAVLDIAKVFALAGKLSGNPGNTKVVTAVLVVKRSLIGSEPYNNFAQGYQQALEEIADQENLFNLLQTSLSEHIDLGDLNTWKAMNVTFANPFASQHRE